MVTRAQDIMEREPPTVERETPVKTLAELLLTRSLDGVCVVEDGRLLGVVTAMDLIFQEKAVHLPSFFVVLDAFIPMEWPSRVDREVQKIVGATVADIMTRDVETCAPDTPLEELAAKMVDHHRSLVPIVDDGRFVGTIDKRAMLRAWVSHD